MKQTIFTAQLQKFAFCFTHLILILSVDTVMYYRFAVNMNSHLLFCTPPFGGDTSCHMTEHRHSAVQYMLRRDLQC